MIIKLEKTGLNLNVSKNHCEHNKDIRLCLANDNGTKKLYKSLLMPSSQLDPKGKEFTKFRVQLNVLNTEAKVLKEIDHTNIVKFYSSINDQFTLNGERYFAAMTVLEFCEKGSLYQRIYVDKNIKQLEIYDWIKQLILAIDYLHNRHILHGKIQSKNILLDRVNEIKLADFSLSQLNFTSSSVPVTHLTDYSPPEQTLAQIYTLKADVYSFGCVLYELFKGKHPFKDKPRELKYYESFDKSHQNVDENLWYLILAMLKRDLNIRPDIRTIRNIFEIRKFVVYELEEEENTNSIRSVCRQAVFSPKYEKITFENDELNSDVTKTTDTNESNESFNSMDSNKMIQEINKRLDLEGIEYIKLIKKLKMNLIKKTMKTLKLAILQENENSLKKKAEQFVQKGREYLTRNENNLASDIFLTAELIHPNLAECLNLIGEAYLSARRVKSALQRFLRAFELDDRNCVVINNIGTCYLKLKNYDNALWYFDRAHRFSQDDLLYLHNKGVCLYEMENYHDSIQCFNQMITLNQREPSAYFYKHLIYKKLLRYPKAEEYILKGVQFCPDNVQLVSTAGFFYYSRLDYRNAIKYFIKAVELNETDNLYYYLSCCYFGIENYRQAISYIDNAIRLLPKYDYYILKAEILLCSGKNENADTVLNRIFTTNSRSAYAKLFTRAEHNFETEHYDIALKFFQKLNNISETDVNYDYIAKCYLKLDNRRFAFSAIENAIRLNRHNRDYHELKEQILRYERRESRFRSPTYDRSRNHQPRNSRH